MNELKIMNIEGIEGFEKNGTVYLKLETVARGLGFTTVAASGNECVRWNRVANYLKEIGFDRKWSKDSFIPENVFYRLAMKAKNEVAEKFQAKIADEVIPSIRKTGSYTIPKAEVRVIPKREPEVSLSGLARVASVARKAVLDTGGSRFEAGAEVLLLLDYYGLPVPEWAKGESKKLLGNLNFFDFW